MGGPTPEFVALVKDALECIYDPVQLESHPLGAAILPGRLPPGTSRVQALRQALLDAVDQLDPGPSLAASARQRRLHQIVELRYVEGLPFREVMVQLGLSQTQYHRDQRHAVEAVATLLWEARAGRESGGEAEDRPVGAPLEPARPAGNGGLVDLGEVTRRAVEVLGPVARAKGIGLRLDVPPSPVLAHGSSTILRQLAICLVGALLGGAGDGEIVLAVSPASSRVVLRVSHVGTRIAARDADATQDSLADAEELLQSLGGTLSVSEGSGCVAVDAVLPLRRWSLLVIDDNPDAIQLVDRFLADQDYCVLRAQSVAVGLDLARQAKPDVILLDVMMPGQDGWDALQALKNDPATQDIPVLVCTVLRERQLALALGAAEFIRKPLTLPVLLDALARWAPAAPRSEAGHRA